MGTRKRGTCMRKISGYVCARNALELDYCLKEAVCSLVPICDEVVVCDGESTDATRDLISSIGDSRIRIITYPWPNPKNDPSFWVKWLNFARERLSHDYQISLDADEVLDPVAYDTVRRMADAKQCGLFRRLNYWRDPYHLVPHNRACGEMVARCGPQDLWMPSDEPHPAVSPNVRTNSVAHPGLVIHHYGFLRKPDAFVEKSKAVQQMFFGSVDTRLTQTAAEGKRWDERDYFDGEPLREYHAGHPDVIKPWLQERGHHVA